MHDIQKNVSKSTFKNNKGATQVSTRAEKIQEILLQNKKGFSKNHM